MNSGTLSEPVWAQDGTRGQFGWSKGDQRMAKWRTFGIRLPPEIHSKKIHVFASGFRVVRDLFFMDSGSHVQGISSKTSPQHPANLKLGPRASQMTSGSAKRIDRKLTESRFFPAICFCRFSVDSFGTPGGHLGASRTKFEIKGVPEAPK